MKKLLKSLMLVALAVFALASCEDVPQPYSTPTSSGGTGTDTTTVKAEEITCAKAVELVNALSDGATSTETYTITGYITSVFSTISNNQQSFYMADTKDGGKIFEAYWANLPSGVSAFTVGMKVKITGQLMKYVNSSSTVVPEMKNATVEIVEEGGGSDTPTTGTEITCAKAVELVNALSDGATSTETYTITGYITSVFSTISNNQQSFYMADTKDGGKIFEAYWANLPSGVSAFTVGMKVKITGQLMKYVNSSSTVVPEMKNATVEIIEAGSGDTPTTGTEVTCAKAVELTNALGDGATSTETYSVTGYITSILGSVSSNQQSFYMADTKDGGSVFEAYWANLPSGVSEFTVGMKVKITGKLMKYVKSDGTVIPEIKNADVTIIEGGTTPTSSVITLDMTSSSWGFPEGKSNLETAEKTFSNGTYSVTLTASSDGGYYLTAYNGSSYLMLGKNGATLTLQAFDFAVSKIEIVGNSAASAAVTQNIYVGDKEVSTATTGATSTNTYAIASAYQAAGNRYTLKVTNAKNTQITAIKIYKAQ